MFASRPQFQAAMGAGEFIRPSFLQRGIYMLFRADTASSGLHRFLDSARAEPENRATRRKRRSRKNRSSRRHFENGTRRAVRRAFTAAEFYLGGMLPTLRVAAKTCVVAKSYVSAAVTILKTEDDMLKAAVLDGTVNLFAAAKAMAQTAEFIAAFRATDSADRYAFTRAVGTAAVWDDLIMPVLEGDAGTNGKEVAAQ
jgi:hypothetical protein